MSEQRVLHPKRFACPAVVQGNMQRSASFCASLGEGMNLLSSPLGSKHLTLSPVKLVGMRPQDLVDILHVLWFLCQGAQARGEGKERNIQNFLQSHLWE